MPTEHRLRRAWDEFFLAPASARPIAALRIGLSIVLLAQAFLLRASLADFFAHDGIVQGDLTQYLTSPHTPKITWLAERLAAWGWSEMSVIHAVAGLYVLSLIFLALGFCARSAAAVAWFVHWTFMNTGYTTAYGVDLYAHVFLFYLLWMPSGDAWSIDRWRRGGGELAGSGARLGLRVLQLQLCVSYFTSALQKAKGIQWWNGELIWRALTLPVYRQFDASWLAYWPMLAKVAGWSSLFLELGYCVFIWPRQTRRIWIAGIVGLHLGIAVFLGLDLFGWIMCILTATAFGISARPRGELGAETVDLAVA